MAKTKNKIKLNSYETSRNQYGLVNWFKMSEQEVLDKFAALPNAQKIGSGNKQFVYIPGTRSDKVLLVAHADTVFKSEKVKIGFTSGVYHSVKDSAGIGADDRAGCCMAWQLKSLGHSILIPNAEEIGGVGSHFLMSQKEWVDIVNSHQFALEMDRMNASDLACYDITTPEFESWICGQFPQYKKVNGIWTDVCVLCEDICGFNISVGYYNQHTTKEVLVESQWEYTLNNVRKMLSQENIPKFVLPKKPVHIHSASRRALPNLVEINDREISLLIENLIMCPHNNCNGIFDYYEYLLNSNKCIFCNQEITNINNLRSKHAASK